MQNQVKTIDVDQMWMRGRMNSCSEYVLYTKVKKNYIDRIYDDIVDIAKELKNKELFSNLAYENRRKIYYIIDSIDEFSVENLEELLEDNYSLVEFIYKAHAIRKRNPSKSSD